MPHRDLLDKSTQGAFGTPGTMTLGVVILVPEPARQVLARVRAQAGDPLAFLTAPHITVLPPTTRPVHQIAEVKHHLRRVGGRHAAFPLHIHGTGTFRPVTPVVFARLDEGMDACVALEAAVRSGVLGRPLAFTYHPHITLAHHLPDPDLDAVAEQMAGFDARFTARELHLVLFGADARTRTEAVVPLLG